MQNIVSGLWWLMGSLFSNGRVLLKKLLVDLDVGLSNDFVVGDRWEMIDVKERPLDGPKKGLVELLFLRKTSDMSCLVDVVARNTWMISMLIWKSYEMLACFVITAKPDASDLLMFVADGELPVVDALDVCIDDLPKVEKSSRVVVSIVGCKGSLAVVPHQEAVDDKDAVLNFVVLDQVVVQLVGRVL